MHERITTVNYNPDIDALTRKKRVAAYARVSGDHELSFHSLSAQISHYQKIIAERPDWEFVEVFSDRGVTGTKDNREGFQRMLAACREGKIDIILAKSISRFARNSMILLQTIRELKSLGVDVRFEEEHINTLSEKGELMISILAAHAQEESRQVSDNKRWQYQKAFQKGIPSNRNTLGYRYVKGRIVIKEDEVPLVKRIYSMFLSGVGVTTIATTMMKENIPNQFGKVKWCDGVIRNILTNEKYIGDLRLQKSILIDHITKKRKENEGELPMYYVEDDHDAIISREDFAKVQEELKRRSALAPEKRKRYPLSGLITCAECGKHLVRFSSNREACWVCRTAHTQGKKGCSTTHTFKEKILTETVCSVLKIKSLEGINLKEKFTRVVSSKGRMMTFYFKDGSSKTVHIASQTGKWQKKQK